MGVMTTVYTNEALSTDSTTRQLQLELEQT